MNVLGYQYHKNTDPWSDAPAWAIELCLRLDLVHPDPWNAAPSWGIQLRLKIDRVLQRQTSLEQEMALDFTRITAAASAQVGIINSVLQALRDIHEHVTDLSAQLAAANDPATVAAVQAQLDALALGIEENDAALAAAIAAPGTPGTPAPAPVGDPAPDPDPTPTP